MQSTNYPPQWLGDTHSQSQSFVERKFVKNAKISKTMEHFFIPAKGRFISRTAGCSALNGFSKRRWRGKISDALVTHAKRIPPCPT